MRKLLFVLVLFFISNIISAQNLDLGGGFDVTYSTSTSAISIIPFATYNIDDNHNVSAGFIIAPYQLLHPEFSNNYGSWGFKGAYWAYEYQFGDRRSKRPLKFAVQYNGYYQKHNDVGFINFTDNPEVPFGEYKHGIMYIDNYLLGNMKIKVAPWLNISFSAGCGASFIKTNYDWYGLEKDYLGTEVKFSGIAKVGLLYQMP